VEDVDSGEYNYDDQNGLEQLSVGWPSSYIASAFRLKFSFSFLLSQGSEGIDCEGEKLSAGRQARETLDVDIR